MRPVGVSPGARRRGADLVIIEPQVRDYTPRLPKLGPNDALVLSRFAYMRRRGTDTVLESPRAGALFRLCDPDIAATIAGLSEPKTMRQLRRKRGFPASSCWPCWLIARYCLWSTPITTRGRDLPKETAALFCGTFMTCCFTPAAPLGDMPIRPDSVFAYARHVDPLPAVRPRWPGKAIDLCKLTAPPSKAASRVAALLRQAALYARL